MSESDELKVRFVEDLDWVCEAICCYWIKEIHIDKKHEGKPEIERIIRHEKQHYKFYLKLRAIEGKRFRGVFAGLFWLFANNVWDQLYCFYMALRYPRAFSTLLIQDGAILAVVSYLILRYLRIVI